MIVLAVLGLVLPGYSLARVLRLPGAWAVAFPFSAVLLTETVVAFTMFGIPLRFPYVLSILATLILLSLTVLLARPSTVVDVPDLPPHSPGERVLRRSSFLLAFLVLLGMGLRTALFPLSG